MASPPTKPPRGVKPPKETSGLLMSVIRTLSASESNEQRDRERAKLEKEYKKSDKLIEEYVSTHHQDLTQIMQLFAKLSSAVSNSKERITTVRENLQACKVLLSCRHEELKKLWLEGVQHKHMIQLLEEIEQIKEIPSKVNTHIQKKQYLSATKLLISSISICDGNLQQVEGLKQLKMELYNKKQQLHSLLMQELSKHIYIVPTKHVVPNLKRQGSGREFHRNSEQRASQRLAKAKTLEVNFASGAGDKETSVEEDLALTNPEQNSHHFIKILLECLILLNKLPDAVEKIKNDMESELLSLVIRTTQELSSSIDLNSSLSTAPSIGGGGSASATNIVHPSQNLIELLHILSEQFKIIVQIHKDSILAHIKSKQNVVLNLYNQNYVWSSIQNVWQLLLKDYLDMKNNSSSGSGGGGGGEGLTPASGVTNGGGASSDAEDVTNLSSYYARKKTVPRNKKILFRFEQSTVNKFSSSSNKSVFLDQKQKLLLCKPDPYHIVHIYSPLCRMMEEFEALIESAPGQCTLSAFINNYIKDVFLGEYHKHLLAHVDSITKSSDAWRSITSVEQNAALELPKPLLQSVVKVEEKVQDLRQLMEKLPNHNVHLYNILISVLRVYKDTCHAAYRGIVQPEPEDKRICSAAWLKDEDISRFLKSLPNWLELEASRQKRKLSHTIEESPDAIRERNIKEAEILATNLGGGTISAHEIISDINQLKCLAQLQESMEWFSLRLSSLFNHPISSPPPVSSSSSVPQIYVTYSPSSTTPSTPTDVTPSLSAALHEIVHDFLLLSNTCILLLHLEVRVECFHYLLCKKNLVYIEPKVIELSRVLSTLDEAMTTCLQVNKSKYIFQGIGDVIAKILMSSIQFMTKIDQSDINKMCRHIYTLQQSIASITMSREISLDQARKYFHLLTLQPDEILNDILENGPQYTDLEYMHAIQLIHRSRASPTDHIPHLNKLNDILAEMRRKN